MAHIQFFANHQSLLATMQLIIVELLVLSSSEPKSSVTKEGNSQFEAICMLMSYNVMFNSLKRIAVSYTHLTLPTKA